MAIKMTKKASRAKKIVKKVQSVSTKVAPPKKTVEISIPQGKYTEGVGRRKTAVARVRIYEGKGDMVVNGIAIGQYFSNIKSAQATYLRPFELTGTKGKFSFTVNVDGSGLNSQLGAIVHGMARALVKFDPEFRTFLKKEGLLTRDDRMKETRKIGMGGKARRKRQSPKR